MSRSAASSLPAFHSAFRPRSAAAASAEPPPMPDATGRFLVSVSAGASPPPKRPRRAQHQIVAFAVQACGERPSIASDSAGAGSIASTSPRSVNTARLCSG